MDLSLLGDYVEPREVGTRCICLRSLVLEEPVLRITSCSHIFHPECIEDWRRSGINKCPNCFRRIS